jgi:WD40 repeat protein
MSRAAIFSVFTLLAVAGSAVAVPKLKGEPKPSGPEAFGEVRIVGERMPCSEFVITPDGSRVVFFSYNRGYYVFDVAKGKITEQFTGYPAFHDLTFSPDGKLMATAEWWDGVKVRDAKTGEVLREIKPEGELGAFYATFLPSGKLTAYCWRSTAGAGSTMKEQLPLWDPTTGKAVEREIIERVEKRELTRRWFVGPGRHMLNMTWKTNERGFEESRSCTLTDPATNKESARVHLEVDDFVCDAAPAGHTILVSKWKGETRLIDVASGKVTCKLKGHMQMVTCGAFSPDGKRVVTASGSRTRSNPSHYGIMKGLTEIILWDAATGEEIAAIRDSKQSKDLHQIRFSPDGNFVVAMGPSEGPTKNGMKGGELVLWGKLPSSTSDKSTVKKADSAPTADRVSKFVEDLVTGSRSAEQKAEALYLVLFGRYPNSAEKVLGAAACKDAARTREFAERLIDTKEFREHAEELGRRLGGK